MTTHWPLLHQGSVKDILGTAGAKEFLFEYSDRFSVFDWGGMPDEIDEKGQCLAFMADFFFRHLNISHHGLGIADNQGNATDRLSKYYKVQAVDVLRPDYTEGKGYQYDVYQNRPSNCLVPLEVIFRFGVPSGSSFHSRANDTAYLQSIGVDKVPGDGELLDEPIVEFSTKLETLDRYINLEEAANIAGMTQAEINSLQHKSAALAKQLKTMFNQLGITLWDGKFEYAFAGQANNSNDQRQFMLVDSIGPDELRLTYGGQSLSKEFLREFYKDYPWYQDIQTAKDQAKAKGSKDWKDICIKQLNSQPPPLSNAYKEAASMLYKTLANELSKAFDNQILFAEADTLEQLQHRMASIK